MSVVEQLVQIYFTEETWHKERLSEEEANRYHQIMLDKGRILVAMDCDNVVGYVESWRVNYHQMGRLVCGEGFAAIHEDVNSGDIAYLANTWIQPEYRRTWVYKYLRNEFFQQNFQCRFFIGHALRKKTQPIKVFTRQEAYAKWIKKEEVING